MLKDTAARSLRTFLTQDFSRVSDRVALEISGKAGLDPGARPREISKVGAEALHRAIPQVKIMAPPSACLSPMGEETLLRGLKRIPADLTLAVSRPPAVYRGNPFIIEAGLAFGGEQPAEEPIRLMRFANRVPLQYQQAACSITKAVVTTPWRNYGLTHPRGALPLGPLTLMVHIASVWVPFTSESKEAVAHYPEILREMRLALMELGRKTGGFIRHRERQADLEKKRNYLEKYVPHISEALKEILGFGQREEKRVTESLQAILGRQRPTGTAEARESA
jgi:DNA topoisomerase-6 subunit B